MNIDPTTVLGVQSLLSYIVLGLLIRWFIGPYLARQPIRKTMILLLLPHICHHVGLVVLVPGVVGNAFPSDFASVVGVGEITMLFLAMLSMGALHHGSPRAYLFLWLFTIAGFTYNVVGDWMAMSAGAARINSNPHWYITTFYVPLLLVSHIMVLFNLITRGQELRDRTSGRLSEARRSI